MKKFKLIKTYPNSLKLGTIVEEDMYGQFVTQKSEELHIFQSEDVIKYPEFWEEIKELLFTTEDGKEIYERDKYYTVFFKEANDKSDPPRWKILGSFSAEKLMGSDKWSDECKYFFSKDSAENWLEKNKPQYSQKQVVNILRGFDKEINEYEYQDGEISYITFINKYK